MSANNVLKTIKDKYSELINSSSGKVIKIEEWGLLNLTTKIKNYKKGFYIHYKFEGNKETLNQIDKNENYIWPSYDKKILLEKIIPLVVQINGKKRLVIKVDRDIKEDKVVDIIFKNENVKKYLENNEIKKKIFVPNRLINIII